MNYFTYFFLIQYLKPTERGFGVWGAASSAAVTSAKNAHIRHMYVHHIFFFISVQGVHTYVHGELLRSCFYWHTGRRYMAHGLIFFIFDEEHIFSHRLFQESHTVTKKCTIQYFSLSLLASFYGMQIPNSVKR